MTATVSTADSTHRLVVSTGTALRVGAVAALLAATANVLISLLVRGPLGAGDDFVPLTPGPVVLWTALGALIGAVGWRTIVVRSTHSRALLTRLIPTILVLSLVPDVALLISDSLPGQTPVGVVALMVMHIVTAGIAVTAYDRAMPAG